MKSKKIRDYVLSVLFLFWAVWVLYSDIPDKLFSGFVLFLSAVMLWLKTIETDYWQRFNHRLSRVVLFLTLFLLIKVWLSIWNYGFSFVFSVFGDAIS
ncbi:MAG TPA: hypothetical protein VGB02_12540 [Pyrinomonadaceae bacterium]|jgi:hypothetical protein